MKTLKKYSFFIITSIALISLAFINMSLATQATTTIRNSFKEMLLILPPVFILLGLLDIWVEGETMIKFMGEGSGLLGSILAFLVGSAAAGPLYVAFPIAAAFMNKGVKFTNILIFLGAWSTTKIPMLLFESASLGFWFTVVRFILNLAIITMMAFIINRLLNPKGKEAIYQKASQL